MINFFLQMVAFDLDKAKLIECRNYLSANRHSYFAQALAHCPCVFKAVVIGAFVQERKTCMRPSPEMEGAKIFTALVRNLPGVLPPKQEIEMLLARAFTLDTQMRQHLLDGLARAVRKSMLFFIRGA